jgi:ABC-type sugar transport system ATPase subunit
VLSVVELSCRYAGAARLALDRVSVSVERGATLALVGPSGSGKTTLLRAIAGLLQPLGGDVLLNGGSVLGKSPQARRIALVAQHDALFPTMTVRENLRFALRRREAGARIAATAVALHLADHLDRRPSRLSGGERQRAALARALLSDPLALLLDEPLAHLDPALRRSVRDEVVGVRERFPGPILYVTHDHVEAMSVGDSIAVIIDGRIEDLGEPQRVYDAPASVAVARFLGERPMNLFEQGGAIVGIRPERIAVNSNGSLPGRVVGRESTGPDAYLEVETQRGRLAVRVPVADPARAGDRLQLDLPPAWLRRFDPQSGKALR